MKISLISVVINIVGSLLMMPILGHVGLALATVLASWFGVVVMAIILVKEDRLSRSALTALWPVTIASLVMGIALYTAYHLTAPLMADLAMGAILQVTLLVVIGLISYFAVAYVTRAIPPFLFRRRRGK